MSNNSELYSSGGHLSTAYLHKILTFLLFGTLYGKRINPSPLPGKMHKENAHSALSHPSKTLHNAQPVAVLISILSRFHCRVVPLFAQRALNLYVFAAIYRSVFKKSFPYASTTDILIQMFSCTNVILCIFAY